MKVQKGEKIGKFSLFSDDGEQHLLPWPELIQTSQGDWMFKVAMGKDGWGALSEGYASPGLVCFVRRDTVRIVPATCPSEINKDVLKPYDVQKNMHPVSYNGYDVSDLNHFEVRGVSKKGTAAFVVAVYREENAG